MKYLPRLVLAIACLALLIPGPLEAQGWSPFHTELAAVGSTTTGPTGGVLTNAATAVMFHVTSASTSAATVTFEQSLDGARWYTSATITNPTVAGEIWVCPATYKVRFNITAHTSGTLTGITSQRNMTADPIVGGCKKLDAPANSFGALAITNLTNSGLTAARVPYSSTGGLLVDDNSFTFTGSAGTLKTPNLTDSGLTITRVPYASTAGLLIDSAAFAFTTSGGILDVTAIRPSGLTATRVPFAGTAGLLGDVSGFTYVSGALAVPTSVSTTRFLSTGTAPTVANVGASSCGTDAATIVGKDQVSVVTVGATSGTECRVTFNVAFANAPGCTVTGQTATDLHGVSTTTYYDFVGTLTAGEKITVLCFGF